MRLSLNRGGPALFWPLDFPDAWAYMQLRQHRCGEIIAYSAACGEWFHPAYHAQTGFAARRSGSKAKCPGKGCGREIYPVDTEPVLREAQPALFE